MEYTQIKLLSRKKILFYRYGENSCRAEELHNNIADMEHLIEQLQTECPIEFGSEKKQIDETAAGMKQKYENAMSAVLQF